MLTMFAACLLLETPANLGVPGGSSGTLSLQIAIDGFGGTDVQTTSANVGVGGGSNIAMGPDVEPFSLVRIDNAQWFFADTDLQYSFFCGALGCLDVTVQLRNIRATLLNPTLAGLDGGGRANFDANWLLEADYVFSSALFESTGGISTPTAPGYAATFDIGNGNVTMRDIALGSINSEVPSDSLPAGLSVSLQTTVNFGGTVQQGNYTPPPPPPPPACGDGGACADPHGPGCDDLDCCVTVCDINPACCTDEWGLDCIALAGEFCGAVPSNDRCENARSLELGRFPFTSLNSDTDGPPLITSCGDQATAIAFTGDVWFSHTPFQDNGVVVSTCNHADFDTRIAVYDGCGGTLLACSNDEGPCGQTSRCSFAGVAGQTYLIRVGGPFGRGSGEIDIAWGDVTPPIESPLAIDADSGRGYAMFGLGAGSSWQDVLDLAEGLGGTPATLTTPEENNFVVTQMTPTQVGGPTAIGLVQEGDDEPLGGWRWITDEPLDWTNWRAGEPNENPLGEDFGMIYPDGTWNDQVNAFGNVLLEFEDPSEVLERKWTLQQGGTGSIYQAILLPFPVGWNEASGYAESLGGTLVDFESAAEAQWVFDRLGSLTKMWSQTFYNGGPWTGLRLENGTWTWRSGAPLDWVPWYPGEPNGTGNVASFYNINGGPRMTLDDTFESDARRGLIVEFPAVDTSCPGDVNQDDQVSFEDLIQILANWGVCDNCEADVDGDDIVGFSDVLAVLTGWGACEKTP